MQKNNNQKTGKIIKILLIIGMIISIPIMGIIPFLLKHSISLIHAILIIYPNGILMLVIIWEFIKLFKSLEMNNPFNHNNVKILKNTGTISFIMSSIWFIDLLDLLLVIKNYYINYIIVLLFLTLLFIGVGISLYILSALFKQATDYKEENDLTI
ncbi:MAG: DUF2975 domain-containing protein [Bacilli bacterium]|nr:DUF2975 domain-containing protein [Bacilli bacterium]